MNERRSRSEAPDYLLGSEDDEVSRLAFQHSVWTESTAALWDRAGFGYGETLLDVGCGPGFTSVDLAYRVGPEGRVVAVDASERFLAYLQARARSLRLHNIDIRRSDVHEIDLAPESLDGAFARWVLCFVHDPDEVVRRISAALRPGGAFAVNDYFNYRAFTFAPRSPALDRVVEAVQESWRRTGGDLDIQERVPAMMERCGLEIREIRPVTRIARPGTPLWHWPRTFFDNFLPTLEEMGLIDRAERRAFDDEWRARSDDPSSFLWVPPMVDIIGVRR